MSGNILEPKWANIYYANYVSTNKHYQNLGNLLFWLFASRNKTKQSGVRSFPVYFRFYSQIRSELNLDNFYFCEFGDPFRDFCTFL